LIDVFIRAAGAVAVTIPSCWWLLSGSEDASHGHDDHGDSHGKSHIKEEPKEEPKEESKDEPEEKSEEKSEEKPEDSSEKSEDKDGDSEKSDDSGSDDEAKDVSPFSLLKLCNNRMSNFSLIYRRQILLTMKADNRNRVQPRQMKKNQELKKKK